MVTQVFLPQLILDKISEITANSDYEECGIFLGIKGNEHFQINHIIQDTLKKDKSPYSSIRHTIGIYSEYQTTINRETLIDYIGEWHTHTRGTATPSASDKSAMRHLLNHEKYSFPQELLLGICSPTEKLRIFLFCAKTIKSRELKINVSTI